MLALLGVALALSGQPSPAGRAVHGTVLDPGHLPVPGVEVRVLCPEGSVRTRSDASGRFRIEVPSGLASECRLTIDHQRFAPVDRIIGREHGAGMVIHLSVRAYEEQLIVRGDLTAAAVPRAATVEGAVLRELFNSTDAMIEFTRAMAGASTGRSRTTVDGVPRAVLPPPSRVGEVAINADPYSTAAAGLDGARVDIATRALRREWTFGMNVSPGSIAGRHPLGDGRQWQIRSGSASAAGPLASRWAWAVDAAHTVRSQDVPLLAQLPGTSERMTAAPNRERSANLFFAAERASGRDTVTFDVAAGRSSVDGSAGGLVLPDAGLNADGHTVDARAVFSRQGASAAFRSSGSLYYADRGTESVGDSQAIAVQGGIAAGAAPVLSDRTEVLQGWWGGSAYGTAGGKTWRGGIDVNFGRAREWWSPNPLGVLSMIHDEGRLAPVMISMARGSGYARVSTFGGAAYGEVEWLQTRLAGVKGGVRVETASGDALALLPRVSSTLRVAGLTVTAGAGRFVEEWTAEMLLPLHARSSETIDHLVFDGVCTPTFGATSCEPLRGTAAMTVARQRESVASVAIGRAFRRVNLTGEYHHARTADAPSFVRALTAGGWLERFASDGRQRRDELRARARVQWRTSSIVCHYTWRHARETTNGWYGAPVAPAAFRSWAPATGTTPHEGGFVFSSRTRKGLSASVLGAFASGVPVDRIYAARSVQEALLEPRRPGTRNSGLSSPMSTISAYVSGPVTIPHSRVKGRIGAQLLNVFGFRNVAAPVAVVDSPLYGQPTAASTGRTLRLWFSLSPGQ